MRKTKHYIIMQYTGIQKQERQQRIIQYKFRTGQMKEGDKQNQFVLRLYRLQELRVVVNVLTIYVFRTQFIQKIVNLLERVLQLVQQKHNNQILKQVFKRKVRFQS
ncbi:unnamed protein product [Paramecium sonneborni]|uniref:Uncharacterized protein n=1 Tax=Paramecium sonneborni TaxID=65129 RepID=A0A8S1RDZ2_9CILI|nr:unnamed protein product [Paramecium sonneborni]